MTNGPSRAAMLLLVLCFLMSALAAQRTKQPTSDCGVANCAQCNADGRTCDQCSEGYNLNQEKTQCTKACAVANCAQCNADGRTCDQCSEGYNLNQEKTQCTKACAVANCAQCNADGRTCDQCSEGYNLNQEKTQCTKACAVANCAQCNADGRTCDQCSEGYNLNQEKTQCTKACAVANCAQCNADGRTCDQCSEGYNLNQEKTQCTKNPEARCNTPNCKTCDSPKTDSEICTECNNGNYLTPTKQCTQSCGTIGSYYNGDKVCEPCDPSCAACITKGPAKCTLCPPGKRLQYTDEGATQNGGSCVDECKPEGGASGCETCGATIGGTKYCSKCSTSTEVPVNGVCTADNARAAACKVKDGKGGCTTCESGYFLQDGGCYKLGRQPGEQICTAASSAGKCETCANSLQPNNGACPSCHSTCKTCRDANSANACTTCAAGYYMVGSAAGPCTSCDSNSGSVKGVAGCMSCAPPSSSTGSVLCYLMNGDSAGGSTNKSGLSTGAIAGISVAVIVVVGGLVGFLCWWFLCRGKA
eukprot:XP_001705986.1 VSP [Giardia lamblia ATCC 50803]